MSDLFWLSYVLLWVLMVISGVALLLMYRQVGLIYLGGRGRVNLGGPSVGSVAPTVYYSAGGESRVLGGTIERPVVILFSLPECPICQALAPDMKSFVASHDGSVDFVWLQRTMGDNESHPVEGVGLTTGLVSAEEFDALDIRGTPFAIVIGSEGLVAAKALVNSITDLEAVMASAGLGHPNSSVPRGGSREAQNNATA